MLGESAMKTDTCPKCGYPKPEGHSSQCPVCGAPWEPKRANVLSPIPLLVFLVGALIGAGILVVLFFMLA